MNYFDYRKFEIMIPNESGNEVGHGRLEDPLVVLC